MIIHTPITHARAVKIVLHADKYVYSLWRAGQISEAELKQAYGIFWKALTALIV